MVRGDVAIQKAIGPWDGQFLLETSPVAMGRAGWLGAGLAWGDRCIESQRFKHSITRVVCHPAALFLPILGAGRIEAAGRVADRQAAAAACARAAASTAIAVGNPKCLPF